MGVTLHHIPAYTSQGAMPMLIRGPQGNNEEACTVYAPYQTNCYSAVDKRRYSLSCILK